MLEPDGEDGDKLINKGGKLLRPKCPNEAVTDVTSNDRPGQIATVSL